MDSSGNVWLFGGVGTDSSGNQLVVLDANAADKLDELVYISTLGTGGQPSQATASGR
jgi:hypothetical protein